MYMYKKGDIVSPLKHRSTSNGRTIKNIKTLEIISASDVNEVITSSSIKIYQLINVKILELHTLSEELGKTIIIKSDSVELIKSFELYKIY